MKKGILILTVLCMMLIGCQSDHDAYDVDGFSAVKEYVDTIIPLIDKALDSMEETDVQEITKTNEQLFIFGEGTKYDKAEMANWTIELGLEEGEWVIEGEELFEQLMAVYQTTNAFINEFEEQSKVSEETVKALQQERTALAEMFRQ
ncbi:hypothetical protein [Pseudogracilibacillus sp. ICA-222130]|uniref:hypothetical protein n=1 Tax=Pseudogracilibacillus sp. ICA-222130 TaxID=3134655 RepID=UPI0030C4505B